MRPRLEHHWRVFAIVTTAVFMSSMDAGMVPIIFDDIEHTFSHTPATTLSWVFTAYTIGLASFLVASGRLADRTGRRRMFLIGTTTFIAGSALSGLAPTPGLLIVARLIQGTGHALFTPASLGLILAVWPERKRTAAIAAWITVGGVASGVGPTVGAAVVQYGSWRMAFFLNVLIGVPVLVRAVRVLDDTEHVADAKLPDPLGIGLLTATLALLSLVVVQGRTWGWGDPKIVGPSIGFVLLGALFAFRSSNHPAPVLEPGLLRQRTYRISLLVSLLISMAMMANLVMQAQFLQKAWGYSTLKSGLAVTPLPVFAAVSAPFASRLATRFGHRTIILIGVAMTTLGLLFYALLPDASPDYFTEFLPGIVFAGVGTWGLAVSMINAAAVTDMNADNFGVGTAILQTARQAGGIVGVALFFGLYGSPAPEDVAQTFTHLWLLMAALPCTALVLALRLPAATGRFVAETVPLQPSTT
ncbi:MAG TPA: MFS transporter [Acidimicrobiales bacterium]|nr:MFS transporter [Acidimicrobiales bacterium]